MRGFESSSWGRVAPEVLGVRRATLSKLRWRLLLGFCLGLVRLQPLYPTKSWSTRKSWEKKRTYTRSKAGTASTTVETTIKASEMASLLKGTAGDEERGREEEELNETFTKRRY